MKRDPAKPTGAQGGRSPSGGERREPILDPMAPGEQERRIEVGRELTRLRECVEELRRAMEAEGITPGTPLYVWGRAQEAVILSLGTLVEMQTLRIEDRAEAYERARGAESEQSRKAIDEMRAATAESRARIAQSEEQRRADRLGLAKDVATDIKQVLKDSLIVRERRWNRRQNWTAAAIAASALLFCFIGGGLWFGYRDGHSALARCLNQIATDEKGRTYCPTDVVRGS